MIIFDTDILSMFAKAKVLDVLFSLLSGRKLCITPKIKEELSIPLQYGYSFPADIFNKFELVVPTEEEFLELDHFQYAYQFLGKGEIEAIAIAKLRKCIFATNDLRSFNVAIKEGVTAINIHTILRALFKKKIFNKSDLEKFIQKLEVSDNTKIRDVDKIFK